MTRACRLRFVLRKPAEKKKGRAEGGPLVSTDQKRILQHSSLSGKKKSQPKAPPRSAGGTEEPERVKKRLKSYLGPLGIQKRLLSRLKRERSEKGPKIPSSNRAGGYRGNLVSRTVASLVGKGGRGSAKISRTLSKEKRKKD